MRWRFFKKPGQSPDSARPQSSSLLKTAWQGTTTLFSRLFRLAGGGASGARDGSASSRRPATDRAEFVKHLKAAAARGDSTAAAFYLINLKDLKRRFGTRWPAIAEKVDAIARRVIEARIGPRDRYMGFDGPIFVVLFDNRDEDAAKAKCAMMAAEIEKKLIGGDGLALAVRASTARLEPHLTSELIDPRALASSLIRKNHPESDDAAWLDMDRPFGATVIDWTRVSRDSSGEAVLVPLPRARTAEMENPWRPLMVDVASVTVPEPHFVYRPMWNVARGAVSTFHCFPMRDAMAHATMLFTDELSALKLDLLILRRGVEDIKTGFDTATPFIIELPVHFSTLTDARVRQVFRKACDLVPETYWKRLVCEVISAPEGVPKSRMHDAVAAAGQYFRAVNVRLPIAQPDMRTITGSGAVAVGIDLGATIDHDEKRVMALMDQFTATAEKHALLTYVHGTRSTSLTTSALAAGFSYIDGAPVGISQFPQRMYRFTTEDIYSDILRPAPVAERASGG